MGDGCTLSTAARDTTAKQTESGTYSLPACVHGSSKKLNIGALQSYVLNPCPQGNDRAERNGRSIDGTYLRVQGHLHNKATRSAADANIQQRAYIRMLLLSVKGGSVPFESGGTNAGDIGTGTGSSYRVGHAPFYRNYCLRKSMVLSMDLLKMLALPKHRSALDPFSYLLISPDIPFCPIKRFNYLLQLKVLVLLTFCLIRRLNSSKEPLGHRLMLIPFKRINLLLCS